MAAFFSCGPVTGARADDPDNNAAMRHHIVLPVDDHTPIPQQIGKAALQINNKAPDDIKIIAITPVLYGIKGRTIEIIREDLKRAVQNHHGSAEEIWQHISFDAPPSGYNNSAHRQPQREPTGFKVNMILDNRIGRQSQQEGLTYRTSLQTGLIGQIGPHFMAGGDVRLNIADNIHAADSRSEQHVRRNIHDFSEHTVGGDRLYISWLGNTGDDTTLSLTAGYLEEMYGGFGGELLYRPFGKTYALGVEAYQLWKRRADHSLDMSFTGDDTATLHLTGWYEIPQAGLTLHGRIGRYLDEDLGATLTLKKQLRNGISMDAGLTITDSKEDSLLADRTHFAGSINVHVPFTTFGNSAAKLPLTKNSGIKTHIETIGRDAGQIVAPPLSLYEITEPLSFRHLGTHWPSLLH